MEIFLSVSAVKRLLQDGAKVQISKEAAEEAALHAQAFVASLGARAREIAVREGRKRVVAEDIIAAKDSRGGGA